jgi:hypothetical protein
LTANVAALSPATGTPSGTVEFFANGKSLGSGSLSNGTATLTTTDLSIGNQSVTAVYQGDANFNAGGTSPALAMVVGDNNQLYVNQIYLKVFHQTVDSSGLDTWQPLLADGIKRNRVVRNIVIGPGFNALHQSLAHQILGPNAPSRQNPAKLVNSLFQSIYGHPADPKSLKFYVHQLNSGVSVNQVIIQMLASPSFYASTAPKV